ncbi:hypothetical protein [Nocardiopsis alborubida]|uniref:Uncharacterized protein n=1 Tax=Nocardiopsis alborubida TaxID=146802 RepID=A0A7X6MFN1_9ACTN|nr:hypothetical protein [Nocardiopsis alborubida]NKZ00682.1 hypothetical protein [Nocardiopsis alborubida]
MNPYAPAPPMPGPLKAVRVILIIRIVLAAVLYSLALFGLLAVVSLPSAQVEAEMGMGVGGLTAILLYGLALTAFEVYVAIALGKGGARARTLVLVVVALGFASALLNLLTDSSNPALGIVLMAVILILIRTESAKEWFRVTDPGHQPLQGGHPGQGGYPGPGGHPGQTGSTGH